MTSTSQYKTKDEKSPKKRDRSASEDKLMAAATEVFSKYGFKGSTTKMIASKAKMNESLIARYFEGKEGLLIAIIQRFIEEIHNEELTYPPQESLEDELTKYLEFKTCAGGEERDCLGKIIITHALTDAKFKKKLMAQVPMESDQRLVDRLRVLQEKSKIAADVKIEDICEEVETYMHGAFIFDVTLFETPKEKVIERMRTFISHYTRGL